MKKKTLFLLSVIALTLSACNSEPIRVACVGDSITYGHGIKDREHDTYPGLLSAMLGEKYDVRNFGVSGTTTMMDTDMPYMNEQAYKDALAFNPQIVTIKLGTNDSKPYNWKEQEHFKKDLKIVTTPNESYTTFTEHGSIADYAPPEERYNPGGESRDFDNEHDPF